ncbi:glucosaminidase domain-containing protein [Macellibacteroides fermentans]|uniref:Flagellar protein FlgJ n=1 Tax=Macellibacteroides fermentans TaxID=879969 RepID=A0A8E2A026_9PORP|nr:glucosaminidase domain-containing protein [Macellibacteroides fermentans]NYI50817.1 flagellar protein FlgJ [Macellibacteroides fermentans]
MTKQDFVNKFYPAAKAAGAEFNINPVVILAQAAIESGWGESKLSTYNNFFGITAYGRINNYWHGGKIQLAEGGLTFRRYDTMENSFMDYCRLIRGSYRTSADLSFHPAAFAKSIAYSKYISEVNGDNRASYQILMEKLSASIATLIPKQH